MMDAGTEFPKNLLSNMMLKIGVHIKISAPYNHQSNPMERFRERMESAQGKDCKWKERLGKISTSN